MQPLTASVTLSTFLERGDLCRWQAILKPWKEAFMTTDSHPGTTTLGSCRSTESTELLVASVGNAKSGPGAFDIWVTALAAGGILVGSLMLSQTSHGPIKQMSSAFLFSLFVSIPIMALFAVLERIAPAGPHKSIKGWFLNLRILILYYFAIQLATVIGTYLLATLANHLSLGWIDLRFASSVNVITIIAAFLLSIFIGDFFYYWRHRFQHQIPFLWQQHKLHHMDEQLNASTRARVDSGEAFLSIFTYMVPVTILFRLDAVQAGTIGGILAAVFDGWIVFYHSNIRLHLGRASVLVVGPQVHRIHHSRLPEHRDRNFAGNFPIWDLVFGSYYPPARHEFPPTGVEDEKEVDSLPDAIMLPFRGWARMFYGSRRSTLLTNPRVADIQSAAEFCTCGNSMHEAHK
jgi:sterol desaturase/sphingolipid hydroxylase (fatty acid hydroxylase superfamily)